MGIWSGECGTWQSEVPKIIIFYSEEACLIMGAPPPNPYGHSSPCKARGVLAFSRKFTYQSIEFSCDQIAYTTDFNNYF